ncbi:FtsX-like permease family protein [Actinophytocola oryzae]|uniref:Putative ABC transport system permease protein n=1 Tax=Actinophytocola oryzae TaxID=502181 RepID=A0A4R7VCN2_9PSEU|nr:FtsX-like permease family protein [Actinophytocola oryzae]TDV46854.1 putative ABC transport system permease protein [Actinophytocola oryzae]
MLRATLRGLLARKLRLALAGLAVVLGVMAVSAAMVTTTTVGAGFDSIFATATSGIDVSVTGRSDVDAEMGGKAFTPPVPSSVVPEVAAVDGVRSAVGTVSADGARPVGKDGKVIAVQGPPRSGVAWRGETGMVRLWSGRGPKADDEVAINAGLADRGQFHVGDSIDVLTLAPRQTFRIVGIYGFSNGRGTLGGDTQVAFVEPVAQKLMLGQVGTYSSVTVTADPGVSRAELKERIASALGSGYTVRTGDELAASTAAAGKAFGDIVRMILLGFSGLSLLVGIFLILNTFSILVAQRTGELALMAALGARRRQLVGAVLVEASLVGVVASAVGIGLGIGISKLLTLVMESQSGTALPVGLMVPVWDMVWAFLIGVGVTLVAALAPAVRASRVPPVAAMVASAAEQRSLTRITLFGAVPATVGVAGVLAAVLFDLGSFRWVALAGGIVLGLLGLALLTPIASRTLLPVLGRVTGWSMPSKLGRRNAARNPRRTAITVATLVVTLGLVGGVGVVAQSLRADLSRSATQGLGADLVISGDGVSARAGGQGGGPPTAADGRIMPTFSASVLDRAGEVAGVSRAVGQYVDSVQLRGAHGTVPSSAAAGDVRALASVLDIGPVRAPGDGEVVVDTATLSAQGLRVGGTVGIATQRAGWRDYRIVGSYEPSYLLRGPVFATSAAASLFVTRSPAIGYVTLAAGADATAVTRSVAGLLADNPEVSVQDQTQLGDDAASQVDIAETMLYVLLGLSVVIGILGIVNTMALSILERTRELGLLRAIGLRRSHLVRMVVSESLVMAVFGALLGLLAGGAAGAAAARVMGLSSLEIPWTSMALFLGLAVVAGLLAALMPSTRAAKVNVLSAIAYE